MTYHATERRLIAEILNHQWLPRIGERCEIYGEITSIIYLFPTLVSCNTSLSSRLANTLKGLLDDTLVILAIDDSNLLPHINVGYRRVTHDAMP